MEEIRIPWENWVLGKKLGQGNYGAVYEIHREISCRTEKSALKIIRLSQSPEELEELQDSGMDDLSIRSRFADRAEEIKKEYGIMAQLKGYTNVVYCDDLQEVVEEDGISRTLYIKMELLTPLVKSLRSPYDPETAARAVGKDICKALIACEKADIVHRDIKPQNIFVTEDGVYKLGDFGVARTMEKTMNGTKTGTFKYMAPEVYRGEEYGKQVDIYSLGMVLYWMLNEKRGPFLPLPPESVTNPQEDEARVNRFSGEPLPPPKNGSEELKKIVLKACAFQPGARYQSADAMLKALEGKTEEQEKTPPAPSVIEVNETGEKADPQKQGDIQPVESLNSQGTVGPFSGYVIAAENQDPDENTEESVFGEQTIREKEDSDEDVQTKVSNQNEDEEIEKQKPSEEEQDEEQKSQKSDAEEESQQPEISPSGRNAGTLIIFLYTVLWVGSYLYMGDKEGWWWKLPLVVFSYIPYGFINEAVHEGATSGELWKIFGWPILLIPVILYIGNNAESGPLLWLTIILAFPLVGAIIGNALTNFKYLWERLTGKKLF